MWFIKLSGKERIVWMSLQGRFWYLHSWKILLIGFRKESGTFVPEFHCCRPRSFSPDWSLYGSCVQGLENWLVYFMFVLLISPAAFRLTINVSPHRITWINYRGMDWRKYIDIFNKLIDRNITIIYSYKFSLAIFSIFSRKTMSFT